MSFDIIISGEKRFLWGSFAWGIFFPSLICLGCEKVSSTPVLTNLVGDSQVLFPIHRWGSASASQSCTEDFIRERKKKCLGH